MDGQIAEVVLVVHPRMLDVMGVTELTAAAR
jgi:hypothetical protein